VVQSLNFNKMKKYFKPFGTAYLVFTFLITASLACLKSDDFIDWSWWWVTLPIWGSFAVALLLVVAVSIIVLFKLVRDEK